MLNAAAGNEIVFLLDVDNTLLNNDHFADDLSAQLDSLFGGAERSRYWDIFGRRREQLGVADYLGSLQDFRVGLDDRPELLDMSAFLLDYAFAGLLLPGALKAVAHLNSMGLPVILSDGDVVFQPRKIQRSGIAAAVSGRVLIYVHKEKVLDHVRQRFPAKHYVMIDDKAVILAAMKSVLGDALTTVWVRQGHYALSPQSESALPAPDRVIDRIEELIKYSPTDFEVQS